MTIVKLLLAQHLNYHAFVWVEKQINPNRSYGDAAAKSECIDAERRMRRLDSADSIRRAQKFVDRESVRSTDI